MCAILCVCLFVTQFRQSFYTYSSSTHILSMSSDGIYLLESYVNFLFISASLRNKFFSQFYFVLNTLCRCFNFRTRFVLTQYMVGFIVMRIWCQLLLYLCVWLCQIVAVFSFIHNRARELQLGIGSKISCFSLIAWNKRICFYVEFQFLELQAWVLQELDTNKEQPISDLRAFELN